MSEDHVTLLLPVMTGLRRCACSWITYSVTLMDYKLCVGEVERGFIDSGIKKKM